jgi:hypothetical protein
MAVGEKKTDAQKVAELRKAAEDKTLPQAVRNTYLDRANEIERSGYEKMKMKEGMNMAKGGAVKKKTAKPAMAVMIGLSPAKKMAKGGAAISEYGGKEKYASKAAMMKHEKKESPKMEKKEKKMAFGGYADEGGGGQPMNARQQQTKQATMQANLDRANRQQAAMANNAQIRQTAGNAAQQAAMANAQQAKRMGLGMAKGGSVKKKPMKGVINKFV